MTKWQNFIADDVDQMVIRPTEIGQNGDQMDIKDQVT